VDYAKRHRFRLPGQDYSYFGRASAEEFTLAVAGFGLLYLAASGLILWRTAASFDRIVGRAGRHAHTGTFETDDALAPVPVPSAAGDSTSAVSAGYASIWRRWAAAVVDGAILRLGAGVLGLAVGFLMALIESEESDMRRGVGPQPEDIILEYVLWSIALSFAVGWLYCAGFESSTRRATPGKSLLGIYVADAEGKRVSFARASVRYFCKALSAATVFVGYLMAGFTRRRQALHDLLAGTLVLRA
jgi:uncharacterized RDD family membrane protein YckC